MIDDADRPAAYALLSQDELADLGPLLKRVFPIPADSDFDALLAQLDRVAGPDCPD